MAWTPLPYCATRFRGCKVRRINGWADVRVSLA
jgi:hypothetical protein